MLAFAGFERVIQLDLTTAILFLLGISQSNINCLQTVQNAAVRFQTGTRKFDHISPILCSLNWLLFHYRIDLKFSLTIWIQIHLLNLWVDLSKDCWWSWDSDWSWNMTVLFPSVGQNCAIVFWFPMISLGIWILNLNLNLLKSQSFYPNL